MFSEEPYIGQRVLVGLVCNIVTNGAFCIPDASVLTSGHTTGKDLGEAEINRVTTKMTKELSQMTHEYVQLQLYWSHCLFRILEELEISWFPMLYGFICYMDYVIW